MEDSKNNSSWLVLALLIAFIYWCYSTNNQADSQAQKDLANCQTEFKSFKDGVTYGRN